MTFVIYNLEIINCIIEESSTFITLQFLILLKMMANAMFGILTLKLTPYMLPLKELGNMRKFIQYKNGLIIILLYDLEKLVKDMLKNTTINTEKNWLKIKWIRFQKTESYIIQYKY